MIKGNIELLVQLSKSKQLGWWFDNLTNRPSPFSVTSVPEPVEGPQTTSFEDLVRIMVTHDMQKVAADHVAATMRTNLAEYLEKGLVK